MPSFGPKIPLMELPSNVSCLASWEAVCAMLQNEDAVPTSDGFSKTPSKLAGAMPRDSFAAMTIRVFLRPAISWKIGMGALNETCDAAPEEPQRPLDRGLHTDASICSLKSCMHACPQMKSKLYSRKPTHKLTATPGKNSTRSATDQRSVEHS